jgi:hypothetical protein
MYARRFSRQGDTRIAPSTSAQPRDLASGFTITDPMLEEFKELVKQSPLPFDDGAWQQDVEFTQAMMRFEIDRDLFGIGVAYQNLAQRDPQLQFAVGLFPDAQKLLQLGQQEPARRTALE